jgi:hypothetical protein
MEKILFNKTAHTQSIPSNSIMVHAHLFKLSHLFWVCVSLYIISLCSWWISKNYGLNCEHVAWKKIIVMILKTCPNFFLWLNSSFMLVLNLNGGGTIVPSIKTQNPDTFANSCLFRNPKIVIFYSSPCVQNDGGFFKG